MSTSPTGETPKKDAANKGTQKGRRQKKQSKSKGIRKTPAQEPVTPVVLLVHEELHWVMKDGATSLERILNSAESLENSEQPETKREEFFDKQYKWDPSTPKRPKKFGFYVYPCSFSADQIESWQKKFFDLARILSCKLARYPPVLILENTRLQELKDQRKFREFICEKTVLFHQGSSRHGCIYFSLHHRRRTRRQR
eukprot:TRINITY_DN7811_c0_g1_i1.p1 TRINITY_DN7811_c0_g1~~TRINITY_DN7811_c0_g1_i1.p1  ORF type:complete len:197 (-),score=24.79 TRINITY_DN7811_c0_g1_i1:512-1102(-)